MVRARWARVAAVAIVAATAGAAVYAGTAARSPDQGAVRAQRFELVDSQGRVRLRVPLDQLASALAAWPSQMPGIITVLPGEPAILSGPLAPLSRDEMQRRFRAQLLQQ